MSQDIALLSATNLLQAYRSKQLSPVEATRAALERIDRYNSTLNAYCLVDAESAMAAARAAEGRWHKGEPKRNNFV